jgi:hypothetical protein
LHPILISKEWKIDFRYGTKKPDSDEIANNYKIIGKKHNEVFPIIFRSDVEVRNSLTEGVIEGFMYFDQNLIDFFNIQSSDIIFIK